MNEGRKVRKFEWGLHLEIRQQLYVFKLSTYSAVLAKAQLVERNFRIFPPAMGNSRPPVSHRRSAPTAPTQQNKIFRPVIQAPPQTPVVGRGRTCQHCDKNRRDRPYYRLNNTYRICGSTQYYTRECPRNQNQARPPIQGRAYNLTQQDAEVNPDVI